MLQQLNLNFIAKNHNKIRLKVCYSDEIIFVAKNRNKIQLKVCYSDKIIFITKEYSLNFNEKNFPFLHKISFLPPTHLKKFQPSLSHYHSLPNTNTNSNTNTNTHIPLSLSLQQVSPPSWSLGQLLLDFQSSNSYPWFDFS